MNDPANWLLPVSSAICASSAACDCGVSPMVCSHDVIGLPVDGSTSDFEDHDEVPQGVTWLGRFVQSARVCAS